MIRRSALWAPLWYVTGAVGALYLLVLLAGAAGAARRSGVGVALFVPVAIAIMHFTYGLGAWYGIWSWVILKGRHVPQGPDLRPTR